MWQPSALSPKVWSAAGLCRFLTRRNSELQGSLSPKERVGVRIPQKQSFRVLNPEPASARQTADDAPSPFRRGEGRGEGSVFAPRVHGEGEATTRTAPPLSHNTGSWKRRCLFVC